MTLRRRALWLAVFALFCGACFAQQHGQPPAHPPEGGAAPPASGGQAPAPAGGHGEAPAGEHAEKPLVLFGKWHVPPLLVEIFRWTNFLVLFGLLGYLLRQPMTNFFEGRRGAILEGLESGRRAAEEAAERALEIERRLAGLESEIAELRAATRREAQAETERLRAAARAETEKVFAAAEQEIRALAKAARSELKGYAAALAVELAEQRIRARMTPQKQAELLRGYAGDLSKHG